MGAHRGPATKSYAGLTAYSTLAATIVAILLLGNWPTYHHLIRGGPPLVWYYGLVGILMVPIVCATPDLSVRFMKEGLFWWTVVYVVSGSIWLWLSQDFIEAGITQWRSRLSVFGLFYAISILCFHAKGRVLGVVIAGCVVVACAATW
jgi:hypothetical protein